MGARPPFMENHTIIKIAAAALAGVVVIMLIWHLLPIILGLLAIIGFGVVIHIFSQKP
jgi:hypothetical protein